MNTKILDKISMSGRGVQADHRVVHLSSRYQPLDRHIRVDSIDPGMGRQLVNHNLELAGLKIQPAPFEVKLPEYKRSENNMFVGHQFVSY
ncbi:hypothetical protein WA026_004605 [Henosepilachna vigintioctopunctata]|uniref:Uncharacterized protein n=1 Tax=Henosepilachna vigintioctopunctata TaxID=420089 RepID=A0AAW1V850_9CUCU